MESNIRRRKCISTTILVLEGSVSYIIGTEVQLSIANYSYRD